jgi:beta-lactamase regulating signal transducer with metallopeptidase domain
MILSWMIYSLVTALLCALAARVLERAVRQRGWPIRALWVGAMAASLLLPVLPRLIPDRAPAATPPAPATAVSAPAPPRPSVSAIPAEILLRASSENLPRSVNPDRLFGGLWMAGSAAALAFLLASAWALGRRRRGWRRERVDGREVLVSPDTGPAVVGLLRSRIVVPEWALSAETGTRSMLLAHEEEHIRAHDPRLLLGALMAAVALPWNPALWWQLRRLRLAIEVDCDLRVLGRGVDPRAYSRLLVDVGERGQGNRIAVLALSESFSSLERRIRLMLTSRSRGWWLRAAGSVVFAGVLLAAACMEPRPTAPKPAGEAEGARAAHAPERPGLYVNDGMPLVYDTNQDLVLDALKQHVPSVLTRKTEGRHVHVWLLLGNDGRVERSVVSTTSPTGGSGPMSLALLKPFPDEMMSSFEAVGTTAYLSGEAGPDTVRVWWLERNADVKPDPARGIYEFNSTTVLPPRAVLEAAVQERYPEYAKHGIGVETPVGEAPRGRPWFIVDADGRIVRSWMAPPVWNGMMAREKLAQEYPTTRFSSVQRGEVRTPGGMRPPVVWATLAEGAGVR